MPTSVTASNVEPSGFFAESQVPQFEKPIVDELAPMLTRSPAVPLKVSRAFCPGRVNDKLTAEPSTVIGKFTSDDNVMVMLPSMALRGSTRIEYVPVVARANVLLPAPSVPTSIGESSVEPSGFLAETHVPQFDSPIFEPVMPMLAC